MDDDNKIKLEIIDCKNKITYFKSFVEKDKVEDEKKEYLDLDNNTIITVTNADGKEVKYLKNKITGEMKIIKRKKYLPVIAIDRDQFAMGDDVTRSYIECLEEDTVSLLFERIIKKIFSRYPYDKWEIIADSKILGYIDLDNLNYRLIVENNFVRDLNIKLLYCKRSFSLKPIVSSELECTKKESMKELFENIKDILVTQFPNTEMWEINCEDNIMGYINVKKLSCEVTLSDDWIKNRKISKIYCIQFFTKNCEKNLNY